MVDEHLLRQGERAAEAPASRWWPAAAVGACLLGMGTKEVMVTAPLLLLLFDFLKIFLFT